MFLALVTEGSFSLTAERLEVSVSTLSRRIAALESELGVTLFERTTRQVLLTEVGKSYAERLRPLLTELDDLESTLDSAQLRTRALRVASPLGLARPFFGHSLAEFYAAAPDVEVIWSLRSEPAHPLRDGFDIVITERRLIDPELIARKVIRFDMTCVAAPSYLARRGRPRSASELHEHDVLVLGRGRTPVSWPLAHGGRVHLAPKLRCNSYGLLLDAALEGLGVALIPRLYAEATAKPDALEFVLEDEVSDSFDTYICYARSARRRESVQAFVRFVFDYVKRHPLLSAGRS